MTDWVLSIDFGTSFSSAATRGEGPAALVRMPSAEGPRDVMPSAVFQSADGELVVGWVAQNQALLAPDRFEATPKRVLGVDEHLVLGGEPISVAQAVAAILERVLDEARRSRGGTAPTRVSLTHPASWAAGRVDALVEAARLAGIDEPRVLSEPEAAALHFVTERVAVGGLVAVYDLGGGTFDAAVLERVGDASFRLAGRPGGRDGLGGEEFDRKLYEDVAKQLAFEAPEQWATIRANPRSHRDFRIEVRRAKEALSYSAAHDLYVPEATERSSWRVTRDELEQLIRPDLDASVEILAQTLADAGIEDPADPSQLTDVYLAGGSSRIPLVAQAIGERLARVPRSLDEPKTVVALGATAFERSRRSTTIVPTSPPTHVPVVTHNVALEPAAGGAGDGPVAPSLGGEPRRDLEEAAVARGRRGVRRFLTREHGILIGTAVVALVGALVPWAKDWFSESPGYVTALQLSVSMLTLGAIVLLGFFVARRKVLFAIVAGVLAAIAAVLTIVAYAKIRLSADDFNDGEIAWGMYVALVGSVCFSLATAFAAVRSLVGRAGEGVPTQAEPQSSRS